MLLLIAAPSAMPPSPGAQPSRRGAGVDLQQNRLSARFPWHIYLTRATPLNMKRRRTLVMGPAACGLSGRRSGQELKAHDHVHGPGRAERTSKPKLSTVSRGATSRLSPWKPGAEKKHQTSGVWFTAWTMGGTM